MPVQDSDGRTVLLLVGYRHDADVFYRYHGIRPEVLTMEGCEGRDLTECTIIKYGEWERSPVCATPKFQMYECERLRNAEQTERSQS